jgi:hypothetical protein
MSGESAPFRTTSGFAWIAACCTLLISADLRYIEGWLCFRGVEGKECGCPGGHSKIL